MTPDNRFTDAALERAMTEIRNDSVDPAVMEAAAARVWARLAKAAADQPVTAEHIRSCADFQSLFPEYRAGHLPKARALLVEDHLHQCVACRRVYEGKIVALPAPVSQAVPVRSSRHILVWAAAAAAVVVASSAVYIYMQPAGAAHQRAFVQTANGRLYLVTSAGFQPLAVGQDLPDGVEIRTAQDSNAVLKLHDGSQVELKERSGFSSSESGTDLTVHLLRGSVIVEAAKRHAGHLYVDTADCHVAVTGTIFGVDAGAKGSRVSVVEGQVHVTPQGAAERVLKPGEQAVTTDDILPEPVRDDIAWSRNRDRYYALLSVRAAIEQVHLPELRYSSRLLNRLPANTVLFASIPNLADYLGKVESVFHEKLAETPALGNLGERTSRVTAVLDKLRDGGGYLGDEIVVAGVENGGAPVLFAEVKRDGFAKFLDDTGLKIAMESRNGFVVFGPDRSSVERLAPIMDNASGGFQGTPLYARIAQAYAEGAGLLLCADLADISKNASDHGLRYFVAEQKEVNHQMEARATIGMGGDRHGPAAWLADPAPMGSLDYISPDATGLGAFVVRDPGAILEQITGIARTTPSGIGAATPDVQSDLQASLGGEFAFAIDGPVFPVPSWKLIVETYDPARTEAAIERLVAQYNQHPSQMVQSLAVKPEAGEGGGTWYSITGTPKNPLIEAHYTFRNGYLIAAPSRALVARALQMKDTGTSILRSSKFLALTPRDHYANFSAVVYQDMGNQLAPLAGLLSGMAGGKGIPNLGNLKPMLVAAYSDADALTVASNSDVLGSSLGRMLTNDPGGWAAGLMPFGQMTGTRERKKAYR